jgi:glutaredoxin
MKSATIGISILAAVLAVASQAQAQTSVYRWVDKDGKVHFSDAPPSEEAREVSQKRMGGGYVDEGQLPYATQMAMRRSPVTLYTSRDCGDLCASGRELLVNRGIPYSERNAQTPAEAENIRKLVGSLEVPVLVVGEISLKGFSEAPWHSALDGAGYPRTKLPGQVMPRQPEPVPAAPPKAAAGAAPAPPAGTTQ